jgi:hypothetical protein
MEIAWSNWRWSQARQSVLISSVLSEILSIDVASLILSITLRLIFERDGTVVVMTKNESANSFEYDHVLETTLRFSFNYSWLEQYLMRCAKPNDTSRTWLIEMIGGSAMINDQCLEVNIDDSLDMSRLLSDEMHSHLLGVHWKEH